jgi:glucosamine 6-phosphate synthetase-like amidotransferase/phosphosugar isomerase protein
VSLGYREGGVAPIFTLAPSELMVLPTPQALTLTSIVIGVATSALVLSFAMVNQFDRAVKSLSAVSDEMARMLQRNGTGLIELAERFKDSRDFYFIARAINFPIASEAALKLKEISYIHAEAIPPPK